jgi:uncharacterized protein with PIN domain|tara:strand:- start:6409 stop:6642 length:234 start_codon:yes stop_codon:yes gene_type:complete
MKVEKWIELEEIFTELMGHSKGIDTMVDEKRDVAPKKPICDLSEKEDNILIHRLREKYKNYQSARASINNSKNERVA